MQDRYPDQLHKNGHQTRTDDLEKIARLGIKTIRYPVVWERMAPTHPDQIDWSWTDERLGTLRRLGMNPIAGLLHHGSGPLYCTFDQPDFPDQLARFARRVAERYPWMTHYNPVNEPLTTARFAGLYGHWYPHQTDNNSFCRILLNECKGIALAMREIRQVQPAAVLVQTEDLGKTYSTDTLQYQADFENERRWLGYDLLCGRVNEEHPLWRYLLKSGIAAEELRFFEENPCPPDILGLDYYLTSERYLDDAVENYPPHLAGGNGKHRYVDIEAVRAPVGIAGAEALLRETWERFKLPMAVTEVHLGCSREEQMRWLYQAWQTAKNLIAQGVDLRAITPWAALGSFDWNSLLTRDEGYYEPGLFDVRASSPRSTALATLVRQLLHSDAAVHPVATEPGWWQPQAGATALPKRPLLIFTNSRSAATAFTAICQVRGLAHHVVSNENLDAVQLRRLVDSLRPWAMVTVVETRGEIYPNPMSTGHTGSIRNVSHLVAVCQETGIPLLAFSNDFVFDGTKGMPYTETDAVCPPCTTSETCVQQEILIRDSLEKAMIVRTGAWLNPWGTDDLFRVSLDKVAHGKPLVVPDNVRFSPSYLPEVIQHSLDLLLDDAYGLWHLSNVGEISWAEFTKRTACAAGADPRHADAWYERQRELSAVQPQLSTALASQRAALMSDMEAVLHRYWQEKLTS
ncbi:MAG: sugar nucleotide-binding protein [Cytophagales bacterium]|nr:sugar nucleotide-binding protein [Cytophagales bacterium]